MRSYQARDDREYKTLINYIMASSFGNSIRSENPNEADLEPLKDESYAIVRGIGRKITRLCQKVLERYEK